MIEGQIDCIVRFHDSRRLLELERCMFSLIGQRYRPLRIVLVTQRFTSDEQHRVRAVLAPLLALPEAPELVLCDWAHRDPPDARTELLNMGLQAATGRYIAFLDYDDTLFPEAYELLISRLHDSAASIAFASVRTVSADVHADFVHVSRHVRAPFGGTGLKDLFQGNFCPIHSYLIDRSNLPDELLRFDTSLVWEEDYDLLLRLCASATSDFKALHHVVGDYYFKTDDSNSIWSAPVLSAEKLKAYEDVAARIEMRRLLTVVAPEVQRALLPGPPEPGMSIRGLLDVLGGSNR